jgi:hypothetical protein
VKRCLAAVGTLQRVDNAVDGKDWTERRLADGSLRTPSQLIEKDFAAMHPRIGW